MKKILVTLMTAMLIMASFVPVFAEKYDANTLMPIQEATGTTTQFDKYLVMNKSATVPYADFLYTVSSDGATGAPANVDENEEIYPKVLIPATTDPVPGNPSTPSEDVKPVVWKGVRPDKVKVIVGTSTKTGSNKLEFTPADATKYGAYRVNKGDIAKSNEKYVRKFFTLDFSDIHFAEPGVYRYYVQESNGTDADDCQYGDLGIDYDVNVEDDAKKNWRTVDVYVVDNDGRDYSTVTGDGVLSVSDYVWYEGKLGSSDQPRHTATSGVWSIAWTHPTDSNKQYVYESNNEWKEQTRANATDPWVDGDIIKESDVPGTATNADALSIDTDDYAIGEITFANAKAAMKAYNDANEIKHEPIDNGAEAEANAKSSEFVNKYGTSDLEFGKKVIGNQGSRDQWFEFKVTLVSKDPTNKPLENGTLFEVNVGSHTTTNPKNADDFFDPTKNSATSYEASNMKTANTVAQNQATGEAGGTATTVFDVAGNTAGTNKLKVASNKIEWTLYIQHGQYVQIRGIPYGVDYTVEESNTAGNVKGYKVTDGTDIKPGVIDNEDITNAHMDPLKGEIGKKGTKTYVKDTEGDYYLNTTTKKYEQLYINPADGKAYTESAYTNEWTGDRFFEDENVYTGVTNKRSGVIPTGIIMSVAGGFAIVLIAIAFLLMLNRRRREYDYE
ncbi:MAG: hypothetical protein IKE52_01805 [Mogibacterium sp.]|nr:hypothetical protein [Mogibacterium sp.]